MAKTLSKAQLSAKSKLSPVSEMQLSLPSDMAFKDIVKVLEKTLTIPELPGIKGCRPCLSGMDRLVIEDVLIRGLR